MLLRARVVLGRRGVPFRPQGDVSSLDPGVVGEPGGFDLGVRKALRVSASEPRHACRDLVGLLEVGERCVDLSEPSERDAALEQRPRLAGSPSAKRGPRASNGLGEPAPRGLVVAAQERDLARAVGGVGVVREVFRPLRDDARGPPPVAAEAPEILLDVGQHGRRVSVCVHGVRLQGRQRGGTVARLELRQRFEEHDAPESHRALAVLPGTHVAEPVGHSLERLGGPAGEHEVAPARPAGTPPVVARDRRLFAVERDEREVAAGAAGAPRGRPHVEPDGPEPIAPGRHGAFGIFEQQRGVVVVVRDLGKQRAHRREHRLRLEAGGRIGCLTEALRALEVLDVACPQRAVFGATPKRRVPAPRRLPRTA